MRSITEVAAEQSPWSASQLEADGNCDAGLDRKMANDGKYQQENGGFMGFNQQNGDFDGKYPLVN